MESIQQIFFHRIQKISCYTVAHIRQHFVTCLQGRPPVIPHNYTIHSAPWHNGSNGGVWITLLCIGKDCSWMVGKNRSKRIGKEVEWETLWHAIPRKSRGAIPTNVNLYLSRIIYIRVNASFIGLIVVKLCFTRHGTLHSSRRIVTTGLRKLWQCRHQAMLPFKEAPCW